MRQIPSHGGGTDGGWDIEAGDEVWKQITMTQVLKANYCVSRGLSLTDVAGFTAKAISPVM